MNDDDPPDTVHERLPPSCSATHPLGRPILGTTDSIKRDHQGPDLRALRGQVHARAFGGGRGGQPGPRHRGGAGQAGVRLGARPGRRARATPAGGDQRGHPAGVGTTLISRSIEQANLVLGLRGAGQDRRAPVRARRAERGVRRRHVLPAVPGGAGEARPGVLGVQLLRAARRQPACGASTSAACLPRPTRCWRSAATRSPGWSRAA